ncbi:hypothetical protein CBP31_11845 [Oceanisphaera profunda]|uniref:C4-dicarboxylate ABC transporter n=1 Tax=Oceanisphaera profunda TaxID=1416627 RepID=A0A1Y0D6N8_9GAMM|nr:hypothetical protein [Oceanisphaera profunda]ART83222.1 hypothetical protein CBP31_11845 [Oceanisphaera profunda]
MLAYFFIARRPLAGLLILLGMLLVSANLMGLPIAVSGAGLAYWLAAALLWPGLSSRNRLQAGLLLLVGVSCLMVSIGLGGEFEWSRLLSSNVSILSMLVAVSFLSLVSRPANEQDKPLPQGRGALASTLAAIHVFGAVINLSSVFIIGDRLAQRVRLSREQSIVLVRGFSAAALWSPFFAAMGVALSVAPNAKLTQLWLVSIPLAGLALGLTYWQLARQPKTDASLAIESEPSSNHTYPKAPVADFVGYPLHLSALLLPSLLAISVLLLHKLLPDLSILAIITLLAPLFSLSLVLLKRGSPYSAIKQLVNGRLPQMGNELALFLAAGILAYGLESVLLSANWQLPFSHFGPLAASVTYVCTVLLALLGIHPIVCIALAASLWSPLNPDHTLLSLVFLSSWALGTATGPLSGINLAFQGRYGVDSFALMRWNLSYLGLMSLLVIAGIYLLAAQLGI